MTEMMSDIEKQVRARVEELAPLAAEYQQLLRMVEMFEEARGEPTHARKPAPRKPSAQRKTRGSSGSRASGGRSAEALRLVGEQPGITVAELAEKMGTNATYLYRVMPRLEKDGAVKKVGTGYELQASPAK